MQEQRRSKRMDVSLELNVSSIFRQNNVVIKHFDSPIHVNNISKHGIGFTSKAEIPLDYYFNAKIQLGNAESILYTVIKVIRRVDHEDGIEYGCEFVGLAPIFDYVFDDYDKEISK